MIEFCVFFLLLDPLLIDPSEIFIFFLFWSTINSDNHGKTI